MLNWFEKTNPAEDIHAVDMPALLLDKQCNVIDHNKAAHNLVQLLRIDGESVYTLAEQALKSQSFIEGRIQSEKLGLSYLAKAISMGKKNTILILCHDMSSQEQLFDALVKSRNMFRDMIRTSCLFGFEVNHRGRFTYVGPGDVLGYPAADLVGEDATQFLWPNGGEPADNPFLAKKDFSTGPLKVKSKAGEKFLAFDGCVVKNDEDQITHIRGLSRDVTDMIEQKRMAQHQALRQRLQSKLISLLQQKTSSASELLDNAAETLCTMMRADRCSIFIDTKRGMTLIADYSMPYDTEAISSASAASPASPASTLDTTSITEKLTALPIGQDALEIDLNPGTGAALIVRLIQDETTKGLVLIDRNSLQFPWSIQEKALLGGVAEHIILALNQAELVEKLTRLSSRDDLTGLMNRRAFMDATNTKLKYARTTGHSSVLLYIDLDYFKEINDTLGHAAGDLALKLISGLLTDTIREGDVVARIGGDEFLMWLEGASLEAGIKKAEIMLSKMPAIREQIKGEHLRLSLSIGIIESESSLQHDVQDMADLADKLMYEAKKKGKGTYVTGAMKDTTTKDKQEKG